MNRLSVLERHLSNATSNTATASTDGNMIERNQTTNSGLFHSIKDAFQVATGDLEFSAKKHGGLLVAEVFKAHGVEFVFTLSGGHISPILVAAQNKGIRVIDTRHEVTAVYAADAVGRLTGKVGVAAVTAGPGLTNTITALKNAQMAESPVLLISGAAATLSKGRGALQDIEQIDVVKSICKYTATVRNTREIVPILREAFQFARSGVPGPVYVELPLDILYPISEASSGMSLSERKYARDVRTDPKLKARVIIPSEFKGFSVDDYLSKVEDREAVFLERSPEKVVPFYVDAYMKFQLRYLYANCWSDHDFSPLPVSIPQPNMSDVRAVVDLLKQAKRPLLLIGSQATIIGPSYAEALARACADMKIPVFLGGMARGLLGQKSPLHIRQNRGVALAKADVVCLVGAIADFRLSYGQGLSRSSKIVTINRSRTAGTMNAGLFWNPAIVAESDPALFMLEVAKELKSLGTSWEAWRSELKVAEEKTDAKNQQKAKAKAYGRVQVSETGPTKRINNKGPELINPLELCLTVEEILPDNALLIGDGGDFVATAAYILRPRGPLRWMDSGAFGTLGCGGGLALGAKLCRPDLEVWLLYGDGSSGYSLAEFDTFARHNAPIVALIGNDASWTQIEREQVPLFGSDVSCALSYRPYEQVAIGYGGQGLRLDSPKDDIRAVLQKAQKIAQKEPVCVNALIGGTDFREGSISV